MCINIVQAAEMAPINFLDCTYEEEIMRGGRRSCKHLCSRYNTTNYIKVSEKKKKKLILIIIIIVNFSSQNNK